MSQQMDVMTSDRVAATRGQLLVIDDEEEILKSLKRQFRRDYDVYTAQSAEDGYHLMTSTPIQVVISDQRMPGMVGSEFFGRIKDEFPDAVRLLLTGYSDIQAVIAAINDGNVHRYIVKPWDPVELEAVVREAFERYNLIVQNRMLLTELSEVNVLLEQRVTERTAELEAANERLKMLIEQRAAFMGMAAHDLRSPITIVQGFTDLLLDPRTPQEDHREFIQIIREAMQDMLMLLNDLLDITAIESGKVMLRIREVDGLEFSKRVVKLNRRIGERKNIRLEGDFADDLSTFRFDPQRMEQVLSNLIGNAFKFSHSDTVVTLRVRRDDNAVEFAVSDQGLGIRDDEIEHIFGAFQRMSNRPTANEHSTGLGLSISKRLVELHQGQIRVESSVGEGSCFYVTLPLLNGDSV